MRFYKNVCASKNGENVKIGCEVTVLNVQGLYE